MSKWSLRDLVNDPMSYWHGLYQEDEDSVLKHEGGFYSINALLLLTHGRNTTYVPTARLAVELSSNMDMERINRADLDHPIICLQPPPPPGPFEPFGSSEQPMRIPRSSEVSKYITWKTPVIDDTPIVVLDGFHRVARAKLVGKKILDVRFVTAEELEKARIIPK